jgi:hypothetical protein
LFREDRWMIFVESDETLREEGSNSLLDLRGIGMHEAVAERITRLLALLGRQPIAELMQEAAAAVDSNEKHERDNEGAEGLGEKGLH